MEIENVKNEKIARWKCNCSKRSISAESCISNFESVNELSPKNKQTKNNNKKREENQSQTHTHSEKERQTETETAVQICIAKPKKGWKEIKQKVKNFFSFFAHVSKQEKPSKKTPNEKKLTMWKFDATKRKKTNNKKEKEKTFSKNCIQKKNGEKNLSLVGGKLQSTSWCNNMSDMLRVKYKAIGIVVPWGLW